MSRQPFTKESGPDFPLGALPEWVGVYVEGIAASMQVPLNMPAAFALGALATAGAGKARVNPHGDWEEPLNLFLALIAPPGAKKSATVSAFLKPLAEFEQVLGERAKPELRRKRIERQRIEAELAAAENDGDWTAVETLQEELENAPEPVAPRLTADDVTAQKLTSLLAAHGGRMAIISAEPSIFPTMLGRWSSGKGESELDVFLKGHAGDDIKVDRLGRPSEVVQSPCLTMAIALQPAALESINRADTAGRGLLARFLWVTAPDTRGTVKLRNARPLAASHRAEFDRGLRAMLELEPNETRLRFDPSAGVVWEEFVDTFELRLGEGGDLRNLHGWGEKLRGMVARIAGLLHLADRGQKGSVDEETLRRAICIGSWAIDHAKVVFDNMGMVHNRRAARAIVDVLRDEGKDVLSRREIHQRLKDRKEFQRVTALDSGFALLVEAGWLTPLPQTKAPGRPSAAFRVHPELLGSEGFEGLEGVSGEAA